MQSQVAEEQGFKWSRIPGFERTSKIKLPFQPSIIIHGVRKMAAINDILYLPRINNNIKKSRKVYQEVALIWGMEIA